MDLTTKTVTLAATKQHTGEAVFSLQAGQTLNIETSPQGEEILSFEMPAEAASCQVHVYVWINEVDN